MRGGEKRERFTKKKGEIRFLRRRKQRRDGRGEGYNRKSGVRKKKGRKRE